MLFLKTFSRLLYFYLFIAGSGLLASDIKVDIITHDTALQPGTNSWIALKLQIPDGVHIYGGAPGSLGLPTTVEWILPEGLHASPVYWPATQPFVVNTIEGEGYQGTVVLPSKLTLDANVVPTLAVPIQAKVSWLACSDMCIPGTATASIDIPIRAQTPTANPLTEEYFTHLEPTLPAHTPWEILILAFLGGLLLNFMPCVFPILGIKILSFVQHANGSPAQVRAQGHMFTAGVVLSFWALAAMIIGLRHTGVSLGWGFQLQSPACIVFLMALFFVMALQLMGVFEVGLSLTRLANATPARSSLAGAFFSGIIATVVATPCTGPFMGVAVGVALSQTYGLAWAIFTALALGMAAPYWLLSCFPKWVKYLPRPGAWMESLKQIMAFPLWATVIWLGWVLGLQTDVGTLTHVSFGLLLLGLSVWIWGRWHTPSKSVKVRRLSILTALVIFVLGVGCMMSALYDPRRILDRASASQNSSDQICWQPWEAEHILALRQQGKAVFVDFTAAWCLTCQANRQTTLEDPQVAEAFKQLGVVAMEADWTRRDSAITQALAGFGRSGVPLNVIYPANPHASPKILPQVLTPAILIEALEAASQH